MGQLPVALSVHRFVNSVGADAGFAAFIGLAILILLYFAQARETNTLRGRVQELLDRIGELEARVSRLASAVAQPQPARGVVAAPPLAVAAAAGAGATAGVAAPGAGARLAAIELPPGPPAGVAAPALSAATRVIPAGVAVRAAAARVPVGVASAPAETESSSVPTGAATAPPTAAPATAAGGSNGGSSGRVTPPPAGIPAGVGTGSGRPASPRLGPVPPAARRPRPNGPDDYQFSGPPEHSRLGRIILVGLIALVVAAVVAVGIVLATGGKSSSSNSSAGTAQGQRASHRVGTGTVVPSTVTVAVLNGTSTPGAAHTEATKLTTAGFRQGKVTNATDQTRTATIVAYIPGARAQALAVAKVLKLGQASVQAIDQNTRAVACQGLPNCTTSVVVTVGADLAQ
jgi:hypothetical protein